MLKPCLLQCEVSFHLPFHRNISKVAISEAILLVPFSVLCQICISMFQNRLQNMSFKKKWHCSIYFHSLSHFLIIEANCSQIFTFKKMCCHEYLHGDCCPLFSMLQSHHRTGQETWPLVGLRPRPLFPPLPDAAPVSAKDNLRTPNRDSGHMTSITPQTWWLLLPLH